MTPTLGSAHNSESDEKQFEHVHTIGSDSNDMCPPELKSQLLLECVFRQGRWLEYEVQLVVHEDAGLRSGYFPCWHSFEPDFIRDYLLILPDHCLTEARDD